VSGARDRLVELGLVRPRPSGPPVSRSPAARVALVLGVLLGCAIALVVLGAIGVHMSAAGVAAAAVAGIVGAASSYAIARRRP
jgi:hypothetical protein